MEAVYTGTWQENTYVITGSSGSGKSEVCKNFIVFGAKIVSADELARKALASGSEALKQVRSVFGDRVFDKGELNRKLLGEIIYKDLAQREKLEDITHPVIAKLAESAFSNLSKLGATILIYDCPLYFETKLREVKFKGIILITADESVKISRLVAREGITKEIAQLRLANQLKDSEKISKVDFVIENNGSLEELKVKSKQVFDKL